MATYFGSTVHSAVANMSGGYCYLNKATCGLTGNITTARIWAHSTGSTSVVFAVYSVVGGNPSARLGYSDQITINDATTQLRNFPFTTPVAVVNGVEYALGILANNASIFAGWNGGGGASYYYNANTYPTPETTYSVDGTGSGLWQFEAGVDAAGGGPTFIPKVVII